MSDQIRSEGYLASNLRPVLSSSRQYLCSYNLELFNLPIHTVPHVKETWCSGVNWESFPHYCHVMKIHKLPKYLKGSSEQFSIVKPSVASFHHLFILTVNVTCMTLECFLTCDSCDGCVVQTVIGLIIMFPSLIVHPNQQIRSTARKLKYMITGATHWIIFAHLELFITLLCF